MKMTRGKGRRGGSTRERGRFIQRKISPRNTKDRKMETRLKGVDVEKEDKGPSKVILKITMHIGAMYTKILATFKRILSNKTQISKKMHGTTYRGQGDNATSSSKCEIYKQQCIMACLINKAINACA
ncbi:hypothetical protein KP509_33G055300 [Ceratopteris richardii]|uniref:Uncharacterized protein n=1 Tax=Ceratopteris richardii TaxID=49495 RepID=A0A8T2QQZ4_CERRI|nr:hypothetical protein KP509_33G055300 [Ceratopteris richardii]